MVRKKKSKACVNAIDKYLMKKRYNNAAVKENKTYIPIEKIKLPKVVVPLIEFTKLRSFTENLIKEKSKRESTRKKDKVKECNKTIQRSLRTQKLQNSSVITLTKISKNKIKKSDLKIKLKVARTKCRINKNEFVNNKKQKRREPQEKSTRIHTKTDKPIGNISKNIVQKRNRNKTALNIEPEKFKKTEKILIKEQLKTNDNASRKRAKKLNELYSKEKKKVVNKSVQESSSSIDLSENSCNYESNESKQEDDFERCTDEEENLKFNKYQPYMERIKLLTPEDIKNYIIDNQQYYIDLKKKTESTIKNSSKKSKAKLFKDSFKCNPFNSVQQIAMFCTLREIFNVPQSQFKDCRDFFTVLMPEISCQLFAEIFHIKVSLAPRHIKKIYPNPVCPV